MEITYIPKNLSEPSSIADVLYSLKDKARNNGVFADFFKYDIENTKNPDSGTYFVVCSDSEPLIDLKRNPEKLGDIIAYNNKLGDSAVNPYYATVKIPEITSENYFSIHNEMCQAIHNLSVVRNAFYQFGYKLPKMMNQGAVDAIFSFYHKGHNAEMPEHLQQIYRESYKKYVSEMNQLYNKSSFKSLKKKWFKKHRVSADYFIDNHIPAVYVSVPETFLKYLEQHLDECPDFVYYREARPHLHLKDISHKYKGPEQWNYWKDFTDVRRYNIGYPLEHQAFYNKMAVDFFCSDCDQKVERESLEQKSQFPLLRLRVRKEDIMFFNTMCSANNVRFSLAHDHYDSSNGELMMDPIVLYKREDHDMITGIVARMAQEERGFIPTDSMQRAAADKNRPRDVVNPFIPAI